VNTKNLIIIITVVILAFLGYSYLPTIFEQSEKQILEEIIELDVSRIGQEIQTGNAKLVDVRTAEELKEDGYAAGSVHFDLSRLQVGELPSFSKNVKVYVYCKGGVRAGVAEEILEEAGFSDVINIGGFVDWEAAGGEVVR